MNNQIAGLDTIRTEINGVPVIATVCQHRIPFFECNECKVGKIHLDKELAYMKLPKWLRRLIDAFKKGYRDGRKR